MKVVLLFYAVIFCLIILGCSKLDSKKKIKVGMTYDEVEKILDKPNSITRGVNQLNDNSPDKPSIETIGTLLYVNWVYNDSKIDTIFYQSLEIKYIPDTTYKPINKYFLNDNEVSKETYYDNDTDSIYKNYKGEIVSKYLYYKYWLKYTKGNPPPISLYRKRITKENVPYVKHVEVKRDVKRFVTVQSVYCVLFDASSGRVVKSDYFPVSVN